jgi:hypothetical protein
MDQPAQNQQVQFRLNGDEQWLSGICVKPRKLWIELDKPHHGMTIADENCIAEWRPIATPPGDG